MDLHLLQALGKHISSPAFSFLVGLSPGQALTSTQPLNGVTWTKEPDVCGGTQSVHNKRSALPLSFLLPRAGPSEKGLSATPQKKRSQVSISLSAIGNSKKL